LEGEGKPMTTKYRVMVDENFDPDERWTLGIFATAEDALSACRRMVDEDLEQIHKPGMAVAELIERYRTFGDDPFIVPIDGSPAVKFSAWSYAEQRATAICA
jgi:hypothetical protein